MFTLGQKPPRPYATVVLGKGKYLVSVTRLLPFSCAVAPTLKYDPFELRGLELRPSHGQVPNYSLFRNRIVGGQRKLPRTPFLDRAERNAYRLQVPTSLRLLHPVQNRERRESANRRHPV